jgi:preprotein translocase subunit SecY
VLKAFLNSFRVPDLRNKILFTLFVIVLFRFGNHVPVPIVDTSVLDNQAKGGFLDLLNLFSGGGIARFSVFSLGIMPYITSSIIIQLLGVVIPKLEQWRDEGAVGQK